MPASVPMSALAETLKFTVEDYYRLYELGFLDNKDRIELLNGELIIMQAIGARHAQAVTNFAAYLADSARRRYMIPTQNPVELDTLSAPQPDLVLIRWNPRRNKHPKAAEVLLVTEVSDTSLRYDRQEKLKAYARTGIPEFWIVNLVDDVVEVFRQRDGETYRNATIYGLDATVSPEAFPDVTLPVGELIPPR